MHKMIDMKNMIFNTNLFALLLLLMTLLETSTGYPYDRTRNIADKLQREILRSSARSAARQLERALRARPHTRQRQTANFDADSVLAADLFPSLRTAEPGATASLSLASEHAHKRQQGWHTQYGKRSGPANAPGNENFVVANQKKRQLMEGLASLYAKRMNDEGSALDEASHPADELTVEDLMAAMDASDVQKRQQGWQTKYGKRAGGKLARISHLGNTLDQLRDAFKRMAGGSTTSLSKALHSRAYASSEEDDFRGVIKRQQGWHTQFGKRQMDNGALIYDDASGYNSLYDIDDFVVKKQKRRLGWPWSFGNRYDYDDYDDDKFSL